MCYFFKSKNPTNAEDQLIWLRECKTEIYDSFFIWNLKNRRLGEERKYPPAEFRLYVWVLKVISYFSVIFGKIFSNSSLNILNYSWKLFKRCRYVNYWQDFLLRTWRFLWFFELLFHSSHTRFFHKKHERHIKC